MVKQIKDTYHKDLLEVIGATPEAYKKLKEKLLEKVAEEENQE